MAGGSNAPSTFDTRRPAARVGSGSDIANADPAISHRGAWPRRAAQRVSVKVTRRIGRASARGIARSHAQHQALFPTLANLLPFPRRGHFAGRSGQAKFTLWPALSIRLKSRDQAGCYGANLLPTCVAAFVLHGKDHEGDRFHACGQAVRGHVHVVH